jgi:hypothetical protein
MIMGGHVHGVGGYGWSTWRVGVVGDEVAVTAVVLPYWLAILLAAIAPAWWIWGGKRRRVAARLAAGCCPRCGYDLRASPGRCPECGAASVNRPNAAERITS